MKDKSAIESSTPALLIGERNTHCSNEGIIIKPGEYQAQCIKYKEFVQYGNRPKLCLEWEFTLSGKEGIVLAQFFEMKNKFKSTDIYSRNWCIANNMKKPRRYTRQYMTPKMFLYITAIVLVRYAQPKFPDGTLMPDELRYPKVSYIKKLTTKNNYGGIDS